MQWRKRNKGSGHKPLFVLLTDSSDGNSKKSLETLTAIMAEEETLPEIERLELCLFVLGSNTKTQFINRFAAIGKASVELCPASCKIDRKNLVNAFNRMASRPTVRVALVQDTATTRSRDARYACPVIVCAPLPRIRKDLSDSALTMTRFALLMTRFSARLCSVSVGFEGSNRFSQARVRLLKFPEHTLLLHFPKPTEQLIELQGAGRGRSRA